MFKISQADFNTILLHAEKISNGQFDFIEVLHNELKNKLGIEDINPLIDSLKKNDVADVQNQTRLFLAQFNFIIEDENIHYHLVKLSDKYCELDIIPETKNVESKEIVPTQNVNSDASSTFSLTLDQRVVKIQFHLQNMAQSAIIIGQELIECKKEVGHGNWQIWLQDNFNLTERTAQRFMKVAERFSKATTSSVLNSSQMFEMLALPESEEEKFIADKAAEGNPVEDMTIKTLRAEIKNWKAQADKNKQEAQKKDAEIENQVAQINNLRNENVKLLEENAEAEAAKKKVADLQDRIEQLYKELEQKIIEVVPPDDYESNKEKIVALSNKIQQLENQLAQNTVSIDTTTAKSLKSISQKIEKQLSKGADVVPRSDFEKLQKELHQLKLQQNPIFTSTTAAQFRTFYDLSETLSLKLLYPDSDLDYCLEYFEQDSISDLIFNLQSITVDLEKIYEKKWGSKPK